MKRTVALLAALSLVGCSSLAPGAEQVKITKNPNDVRGCKVIGPLSGVEGSGLRGGGPKENLVLSLGGDTFFETSSWLIAPNYHGIVYNCRGIDLRQPVPVSQ